MFTLYHERKLTQIFPFYFLDKSDLLELNGIDLPSQLELSGSYELKSRSAKLPILQDFDMDENLIHAVNSKYYDVLTFPQIKQLLLTALKSQFDVIGILKHVNNPKGF